jgi:hypothetical protein
MGKELTILLFMIICFWLVSSAQPVTIVSEFPDGYILVESGHKNFKIGQDYLYNIFVYNYSNGKIINNDTVMCHLDLANYSGNIITHGDMIYNIDGHWSYFIDGGNFSYIGYYPYGVSCIDESGGVLSGIFEVTYLGKELSVGESILYIGFLTLMILLFIVNFVAIGYLPARNERDEEGRIMSISYLKYFRNVLALVGYFLFIAIFYMSSNLAFAFLQEELFAKTLFMIFRVSFLLVPVVIVVWVIWIFASMFHDKEFQKVLNRGMFPGGSI